MMSRIACGIGLGTLLLAVTLGIWKAQSHTTSLAGRYHLRQRTTQFFDRAKASTAPTVKPGVSNESIRTGTVKQPQTA